MRVNLLLLSLLVGCLVSAQPSLQLQSSDKYTIKNWTTSNGLAQNSIRDIIIARDGIVWMASFGGLVKFDGSDFTHYNIGNTPDLGSNRLIEIYEDHGGNLWFLHEGVGMTRYSNGEFSVFGANTPMELIKYSGVVQIDSVTHWLATENGLKVLVRDSVTEVMDPGVSEDLIDLSDEHSSLFVAKSMSRTDQKQEMLFFDGSEISNRVEIIPAQNLSFVKRNNTLWALYPDRLIRVNVADLLDSDTIHLPSAIKNSRDLLIDGNQLWLGTPSGLYLLELEDQEITSFQEIIADINVNDLMRDGRGGIWIGTEGSGMYLVAERAINVWETPGNVPQPVGPVVTDGQGGVWFSTLCDYLVHYDGQSFYVSQPNRCVQSLHYDKNTGRVLMSTSRMVGYLTRDGVDTLLLLPSKINIRTSCIYMDQTGVLWIGTFDGMIFKYENGQLSQINIQQGNGIHTITEIGNKIWIGTTQGLVILSGDEHQLITKQDGLPPGAIRSIYQDQEGTIWMGSYGGGMTRINGEDTTIINTESGLSENIISRIHEDRHGRMWMLGNLGLFMTSKQMLNDYAAGHINYVSCLNLSGADGMKEGNGPGMIARSADGLTWWPTIDGIATINTDDFTIDSSSVHINIQGIKSKNTLLAIAKEISLNESQRDFEISFTGINYHSPDRLQYQHILEGYDEDWIRDGHKRNITYTNLPPGEYTLKIQAANQHHIWSRDIKSIGIIVKPKWWERQWVQILLAFSLVIIALLLIHWQTSSLVRRKKLLQIQVDLRTKQLEIKNRELKAGHQQLKQTIEELKQTQGQLIQSEKMASLGVLAAGVAHEINNPLNFIRGGMFSVFDYLEEKNKTLDQELLNYKKTIEEGINRTSNIVKSLNQFSRKGQSMQETCRINEILDSCLVMLNNLLKDRIEVIKDYSSLTPIHGNVGNLFQVFLNLLTNACHAIEREGTITIKTRMRNQHISVFISDNGVGIPKENLSKVMDPFFTTKPPGAGTGLGLSITYEIIQNHRGHISVDSKPGKGTTFVITFPIASI